MNFFFGRKPPVGKCCVGAATTLGVVKPHVVLDCAAGLMLDCVMEHFDITAAEMFKLDKTTAAEFYEVRARALACVSCAKLAARGRCQVPRRRLLRPKRRWARASGLKCLLRAHAPPAQVYKGVLSPGEFNAMTDELTSGPSIAFEVADRDGADSVEQVRGGAGCGLCPPDRPRPGGLWACGARMRVRSMHTPLAPCCPPVLPAVPAAVRPHGPGAGARAPAQLATGAVWPEQDPEWRALHRPAGGRRARSLVLLQHPARLKGGRGGVARRFRTFACVLRAA